MQRGNLSSNPEALNAAMNRTQIDDLLLCSICLDRYNKPKVLPCQHTFCLNPCLKDLMEKQRVRCPICRAVHIVPQNGIEGFPNNLTIVGLLDIHNQQQSGAGKDACPDCGKENYVMKTCIHCSKDLCDGCLGKHSQILKKELHQSVEKVEGHIMKILLQIDEIKNSEEGVKEIEHNNVDKLVQWYDQCLSQLQSKKEEITEKIKESSNTEIENLKARKENLKAELVLMRSYCEDAGVLNGRSAVGANESETQAETKAMIMQGKERLNVKVMEENKKECDKFCTDEAQAILHSISNFQGVGSPIPSAAPIVPFLAPSAPSMSEACGINPAATYHPPYPQSIEIPFPDPSAASALANSKALTGEQSGVEFDHMVQQYSKKGTVKRCFGMKGSSVGCFKNPRGIAVTQDDRIVVADRNNHRIQIFDASGNSIRTFGERGGKHGEFIDPHDVAVTANGEIIVADYGNNRVQVFNCEGTFLSTFGRKEAMLVMSVAATDDGLVFVTDWTRNIRVYRMLGNFVRKFGSTCLSTSEKCIAATHDNKILVSESSKKRIRAFTQSGIHLSKYPVSDMDQGRLKEPNGITSDRYGNIIVVDGGYNKVQIFDNNCNFVTSFGRKGSEPGQMDRPRGVGVLSNGDIVVSDTHNHRIQIF